MKYFMKDFMKYAMPYAYWYHEHPIHWPSNGARLRGSLVHQIDGFVRKEAVRDVAVTQHRRSHLWLSGCGMLWILWLWQPENLTAFTPNLIQGLVVSSFNPSEDISQLGWLFPIYGKNLPNHQPARTYLAFDQRMQDTCNLFRPMSQLHLRHAPNR